MILAILMSAATASEDPTHLPGVLMDQPGWEARLRLVTELRTYSAEASSRLATAHAVLHTLADQQPDADPAWVHRLLVAAMVDDPVYQDAARTAARTQTELDVVDPQVSPPDLLLAYVDLSWSQATPIALGGRSLSLFTLAPMLVHHDVTLGFDGDQARVALLSEARDLGWPAVGAENPLFDRDEAHRGRFVIGGEIASRYDARVHRNGEAGQGMDVRWQVLDRRGDVVVFETTTRGWVAGDGMDGEALLTSAFHNLMARPVLVQLLEEERTQRTRGRSLPVRSCDGMSEPLPDGLEAALAATVQVEHGYVRGTGTLVSPDGWIWTASHLVAGADELRITLYGGPTLPATLARVDDDMALLKVIGEGYACLPVATTPPAPDSSVFALGAGRAGGLTVSAGVAMVPEEGQEFVVHTNALAHPGSSGGPLLSADGELLGILDARRASGVGLASALSTDRALDGLGMTWSDASGEAEAVEPVPSVGIQPSDPELVAMGAGELCVFRRGQGIASSTVTWPGERVDVAAGQFGCVAVAPEALPITVRDALTVTVDVAEGRQTVLEVVGSDDAWDLVPRDAALLERLATRGKVRPIEL